MASLPPITGTERRLRPLRHWHPAFRATSGRRSDAGRAGGTRGYRRHETRSHDRLERQTDSIRRRHRPGAVLLCLAQLLMSEDERDDAARVLAPGVRRPWRRAEDSHRRIGALSLRRVTRNQLDRRDSPVAWKGRENVAGSAVASRCGRGGTGRRAGLKIRFWRQSVGSIPTARTTYLLKCCNC